MRVLYDRDGAADALSTSPLHIDELRRAGLLSAVADGPLCRYRLEDLVQYANSLPPWTEPPAPVSPSAQSAPPLKDRKLPVFLSRAEVAARLRISRKTLDIWGPQGKGPKYLKVGGHRVWYRESDVEAWEQEHRTGPIKIQTKAKRSEPGGE